MSLPNIILLGFSEAGGLTKQSMASAATTGIGVRYISLPGDFQSLTKPHLDIWEIIRSEVSGENESIVIWTQNSLILWDKLERAFALAHQPDFLWPLSLCLENGALSLPESNLFLAVGGFEISLFGFEKLGRFHHAVKARALDKLLTVCDLETLTLGEYLILSWDNFESVKAPDTWLISGDEDLSFRNALPHTLTHNGHFKTRHQQWLMGREAMDVQTRNTLAASDFTRKNLDIMERRLPDMMQEMPYYGFWPLKQFVQPVSGYHPAVTASLWQGEYKPQVMNYWRALFCLGAYSYVIDNCHDGHVFGLTFLKMNEKFHGWFYSPDMQCAAWAMNAIEANKLSERAHISMDSIEVKDGAILITTIDRLPEHLWGKIDMFIILDSAVSLPLPLPSGYKAIGAELSEATIKPVTLDSLTGLSALFILNDDKARVIMEDAT